ncbi:MAG: DUF998 domain-containing protein [Actinobacteria bacterium]|nr:DUF998 domain-containing protein [Actinomycetota bacterium]
MSVFAVIAAALVVAWAALLIVAQRLNPEQSPLSMGMSGLARGHAPWVMKSGFVCRGASALALLVSLPFVLGTAGLTLAGILALWVWGVGSAVLALVDTDMPGEPPSQAGVAHAVIALVAYVCGAAGAVVLSVSLVRDDATAGVGVWALPLALFAVAAMVLQFVAFGAAARAARSGSSAAPAAGPAAATDGAAARASGGPVTLPPQTAAVASGAQPAAAYRPDVPPQLAAPLRPAAGPDAGATRSAPLSAGSAAGRLGDRLGSFSLDDLGRYAGLFQRVFVGLLMAWTMLVAVGIVRA